MKDRLLGISAAVLASTCCALPLLLVAAGLGSTGLGSFFGEYHWYFQGAAVLLLGIAWFKHLQATKACSAGSCPPANLKPTRNVLILASLFVALFVGNQLLLAAKRQAIAKVQSPGVLAQSTRLSSIVLPVKGMSCASCEPVIEKKVRALEGVGEVEASAVEQTVTVAFDPSSVSIEAIAQAIREAGYEPSLPAGVR